MQGPEDSDIAGLFLCRVLPGWGFGWRGESILGPPARLGWGWHGRNPCVALRKEPSSGRHLALLTGAELWPEAGETGEKWRPEQGDWEALGLRSRAGVTLGFCVRRSSGPC